ncbi:hypothetical protein H072_3147 [Dactylellina haptotyla CBS 200.50]|uniref:F-box domain-containing protein n=1 Tax=Dactylellina haptotyla (strain CBS 200.50) TaxID=1284197 RepID=S8AP48_DACHA|nr:hypothetical protein H072_3147 [Dactylellina haptotyla CBS 200.50]
MTVTADSPPRLPLDIQFLILEAADVEEQGTLSRVSKLWHSFLQNSHIARSKRYIDIIIFIYVPSDGSNSRVVKIHQAIWGTKQCTALLHDGKIEIPPEEHPSRLGEESLDLFMFAEDPIFFPPDRSASPDNVEEARRTQAQFKALEVSFQRSLDCFLNTDALRWGRNDQFHIETNKSHSDTLTLTADSKLGEYTDTLIEWMEELARGAVKAVVNIIWPPLKDDGEEPTPPLWEPLIAREINFHFKIFNSRDFAYCGQAAVAYPRYDSRQPDEEDYDDDPSWGFDDDGTVRYADRGGIFGGTP